MRWRIKKELDKEIEIVEKEKTMSDKYTKNCSTPLITQRKQSNVMSLK